MTTYPQDTTDWVGSCQPLPTPETVYTVHKDAQGLVFLFVDRNGNERVLYTWADGGVSFHWNSTYAKEGSTPYTGDVPEPLHRLVESWRMYLDATVERETG